MTPNRNSRMRLHFLSTGIAAAVLTLTLPPLPTNASTSESASQKVGAHLCHGRVATIVGTNEKDVIEGTAGPDVIVGLDGDDTISGNGGDDVICGGDGLDRLDGGAGDDIVDGQRGRLKLRADSSILSGDLVWGGPGDDLLIPGRDMRFAFKRWSPDRATYAYSPRGVRVRFYRNHAIVTGEGRDRILTEGRGAIVGSPFDDVFIGGPGNDWVVGRTGDDVARLGDGRDVFWDHFNPKKPANEGSDNDRVWGGAGADQMWTIAGTDTFSGGKGADYFDKLHQVSSNVPRFFGGPGPDTMTLPLRTDGAAAVGGPGIDSLTVGRYLGGKATVESTIDMTLGSVTTVADGVETHAKVDAFHNTMMYGWFKLTFIGSDLDEEVTIRSGYDANVDLRGGDDFAVGSLRPTFFDGGEGRDEVFGTKDDTCVNVERAHECGTAGP